MPQKRERERKSEGGRDPKLNDSSFFICCYLKFSEGSAPCTATSQNVSVSSMNPEQFRRAAYLFGCLLIPPRAPQLLPFPLEVFFFFCRAVGLHLTLEGCADWWRRQICRIQMNKGKERRQGSLRDWIMSRAKNRERGREGERERGGGAEQKVNLKLRTRC